MEFDVGNPELYFAEGARAETAEVIPPGTGDVQVVFSLCETELGVFEATAHFLQPH